MHRAPAAAVHATGLLFVEPAVAMLVYGMFVAFAKHDDLGRPDGWIVPDPTHPAEFGQRPPTGEPHAAGEFGQSPSTGQPSHPAEFGPTPPSGQARAPGNDSELGYSGPAPSVD